MKKALYSIMIFSTLAPLCQTTEVQGMTTAAQPNIVARLVGSAITHLGSALKSTLTYCNPKFMDDPTHNYGIKFGILTGLLITAGSLCRLWKLDPKISRVGYFVTGLGFLANIFGVHTKILKLTDNPVFKTRSNGLAMHEPHEARFDGIGKLFLLMGILGTIYTEILGSHFLGPKYQNIVRAGFGLDPLHIEAA